MRRLSACSAACGWCGRCDDHPRREPKPEPVMCERAGCGRVLGIGYVTNPVLGQFCSRACHDAEQDAWEDYMRRRGFQQAR
jgi:hypothetical protein